MLNVGEHEVKGYWYSGHKSDLSDGVVHQGQGSSSGLIWRPAAICRIVSHCTDISCQILSSVTDRSWVTRAPMSNPTNSVSSDPNSTSPSDPSTQARFGSFSGFRTRTFGPFLLRNAAAPDGATPACWQHTDCSSSAVPLGLAICILDICANTDDKFFGYPRACSVAY